MTPAVPHRRIVSLSLLVLGGLGAVGLVFIAFRFGAGLGAATNLSDAYPWGFWIGLDVLVGIALAAGGFVITGMLHLFGGGRFRPLSRPAILTALLGYLLFVGALMVDLGRPWNIWKALISWNHQSPMFEVSWCVMFYTFVLMLEFVPPVLEALGWRRHLVWWHKGVPYVVIGMLTLFCFAMTQSAPWAATTFLVMSSLELLIRSGYVPRGRQMPLLLIMAGVMLSTLHQSSLGTLFLAVDHLHPLWYTPLLPLLFLVSAVMAAPAVVILESTLSARVFRLRGEANLLRILARGMPYLIGVYLVLRLGDILLRGEAFLTATFSLPAIWWWLEILLLLGALVLHLTPARTLTREPVVLPSVLTVGALVVHRVGVSLIGLVVPGVPRYVPALSEILITTGVLALGLLAFRFAAMYLPIYGLDQSRIWALPETPIRSSPGEQPRAVPQVVPS
jgi:Ni/Fe-hydrogenase subunit HybB-like protein